MRAALLVLADVRLFAVELLILMVLLVLGTLAQASMGLYAAQTLFFDSWYWLVAGVIPLPGMRLVLALVTVGLVVRLAKEPLTLNRLPVWLVHAGVILLLAGGALANWRHVEGYVLLAKGETSRTLWQPPAGNTDAPPETWVPAMALPFAMTLQGFIHEYYPGTDMARRYQSDLVITGEDATKTPAAVAMNQPLRYRGWAVYQASYWQDAKGREVSVLAVVQNKGRMMPYLSGLIVALGMLGVLFQRGRRWRKVVLHGVGIALLLATGPVYAADGVRQVTITMPMESFARVPILHNGRLKPMDTFARDVALRVTGTDSPTGKPALTWLATLVFDPASLAKAPMVTISDPNTVALLGLPQRFPRRYALVELIPALQKQGPLVMELEQMDAKSSANAPQKAAPREAELLAVYRRVQEVVTLGRSFSLLMPLFVVRDDDLARKLGVQRGAPFDYMTLMALRPRYLPLLDGVLKRGTQRPTRADRDLLNMALQARLMADDRNSSLFRVLPPAWKEAGEEWVSPWQSYVSGLGGPAHLRRLMVWKQAREAWLAQSPVAFAAAARTLEAAPTGVTQWPPLWKLKLEIALNRFEPFTLTMGLAFAAALFAGFATLNRARAWMLAMASGSAVLATLTLGAGMAARVLILGRPPVATLYESVLFVSMTTLIAGLGVAFWRRDGGLLGLVALVAVGLMGVAHWQAGQGDTLGMVIAVLNTRFWLTTHVLTITGGYGVCLLLAGAAHALLLRQAWRVRVRGLGALPKTHEQGIVILTVLALLLTAGGTVLGGVWADQSWGRFWGWDPKENGALLIVLWLVLLLHLRLAKWLTFDGLLLGAAATTVVVALSWFGVNLLSVGLHSYGFTSGLAEGLGLFVAGQCALLALLAWAGMLTLTDKGPGK